MKVVIAGANGNLGKLCLTRFRQRPDCEVIGLSRAEMDLSDSASIRAALDSIGPFDLLLNCAAWTDVDACETDPAKANQINGHAVGVMGACAANRGARMIHVSTDYVFDGRKPSPYTEDDATSALSAYGASKLLGEAELLAASSAHLAVRVSWLFGASTGGFPLWVIRQALKLEALSVVADKWGSPTSVTDAADALDHLAFDCPQAAGLLHVCNSGSTSWLGWGQCALDHAREAGLALKTVRLGETTMEQLAAKAAWKAQRPVQSALANDLYSKLRGRSPRPWQEAVADYVRNELAPLLQTGQV